MSIIENKAFLVFSGGNDRAVIGFLRALRLCGEHAYIVARTPSDLILRTSFKRDVRWVRANHALSLDIFSECVKCVRKEAGARTLVILPSTEYFNTFLLKHRSEIEQMGCEVPLVDSPLYARLTGKRTAIDFFAAAGIASPLEMDASAVTTPPLIAKPLFNISPAGESLYPHLLGTIAELVAFRSGPHPENYFFQEYVRGDSVYLLFYLSRIGRQEFVWSQRNLLQQPEGKSMLLAEASDFHTSQTAGYILEALREARFHGLGMVEIIRTAERDVFIEMNPRIWGPAQFCLDQQQPLLQAFIGDSLHNDSTHFVQCRPSQRRKRYFWLGGIAETLAAGKQPTWHTTKRTLFTVIFGSIASDVYLRGDSWRCFLQHLKNAFKAGWHHEQSQD